MVVGCCYNDYTIVVSLLFKTIHIYLKKFLSVLL